MALQNQDSEPIMALSKRLSIDQNHLGNRGGSGRWKKKPGKR
jgi:hypothetical protein